MNLYSEFRNGNRKAVVEKDMTLGRSNIMARWYVTMYIAGNAIQKTSTISEVAAATLAEDFVHMGSTGGPTLLNENVSNG
tara:strand:+ start:642 stop:881 length:240 start_codon:yes stop_codon:yes gene_type:complete